MLDDSNDVVTLILESNDSTICVDDVIEFNISLMNHF